MALPALEDVLKLALENKKLREEIVKKDGLIIMLKEDLDYKITLCDKIAQKIIELEDLIHLHLPEREKL